MVHMQATHSRINSLSNTDSRCHGQLHGSGGQSSRSPVRPPGLSRSSLSACAPTTAQGDSALRVAAARHRQLGSAAAQQRHVEPDAIQHAVPKGPLEREAFWQEHPPPGPLEGSQGPGMHLLLGSEVVGGPNQPPLVKHEEHWNRPKAVRLLQRAPLGGVHGADLQGGNAMSAMQCTLATHEHSSSASSSSSRCNRSSRCNSSSSSTWNSTSMRETVHKCRAFVYLTSSTHKYTVPIMYAAFIILLLSLGAPELTLSHRRT
jgi:hypothetical protein